MIAHESYSWERKYTSGMNTGMAVDGNLTMGNFLTNSYFNGSDDEDKTESYLARVKYNYDNRYFIEGSFRRDGSSRFHKDNRWGNFYSVGASWNMKNEAFLKDVEWVDHLKCVLHMVKWVTIWGSAIMGTWLYTPLIRMVAILLY